MSVLGNPNSADSSILDMPSGVVRQKSALDDNLFEKQVSNSDMSLQVLANCVNVVNCTILRERNLLPESLFVPFKVYGDISGYMLDQTNPQAKKVSSKLNSIEVMIREKQVFKLAIVVEDNLNEKTVETFIWSFSYRDGVSAEIGYSGNKDTFNVDYKDMGKTCQEFCKLFSKLQNVLEQLLPLPIGMAPSLKVAYVGAPDFAVGFQQVDEFVNLRGIEQLGAVAFPYNHRFQMEFASEYTIGRPHSPQMDRTPIQTRRPVEPFEPFEQDYNMEEPNTPIRKSTTNASDNTIEITRRTLGYENPDDSGHESPVFEDHHIDEDLMRIRNESRVAEPEDEGMEVDEVVEKAPEPKKKGEKKRSLLDEIMEKESEPKKNEKKGKEKDPEPQNKKKKKTPEKSPEPQKTPELQKSPEKEPESQNNKKKRQEVEKSKEKSPEPPKTPELQKSPEKEPESEKSPEKEPEPQNNKKKRQEVQKNKEKTPEKSPEPQETPELQKSLEKEPEPRNNRKKRQEVEKSEEKTPEKSPEPQKTPESSPEKAPARRSGRLSNAKKDNEVKKVESKTIKKKNGSEEKKKKGAQQKEKEKSPEKEPEPAETEPKKKSARRLAPTAEAPIAPMETPVSRKSGRMPSLLDMGSLEQEEAKRYGRVSSIRSQDLAPRAEILEQLEQEEEPMEPEPMEQEPQQESQRFGATAPIGGSQPVVAASEAEEAEAEDVEMEEPEEELEEPQESQRFGRTSPIKGSQVQEEPEEEEHPRFGMGRRINP